MTKPPRSVYSDRLGEFGELALADANAFARRGAWRSFFASRDRIVLEIGCANGELLCRIAARFPGSAFVGIDWKCKAIYDAATRVREMELTNVALIRGRAQDLMRIFAPRELDEIWIFHPEPCERDVELKNRLISPAFLHDASRALRGAGSRLCLKTDHAGYAAHMRSVCASEAVAAQFEVVAQSHDLWLDASALHAVRSRMFAHERTAYESRFVRRRKPINYLELSKRRD
jgi:tRNA (guanine-N(7)-)-methyltransferase